MSFVRENIVYKKFTIIINTVISLWILLAFTFILSSLSRDIFSERDGGAAS